MNDLMKTGSKDTLKSEKPFVFACPAYAWRMPRLVEKFIRNAKLEGSNKAYFVLTCGDGTGNAINYVHKLCNEKGFEFLGFASVIMACICGCPKEAIEYKNKTQRKPRYYINNYYDTNTGN